MKVLYGTWWLVAVLAACGATLCVRSQAQGGPGAENQTAQQLAAERSALQTMLDDPATPAEKKALLQTLLDWNIRGVTIAAYKRMQAQRVPEAVAAKTPPPRLNQLADAEAAPLPANFSAGNASMLQSFSKGRDADASAKSAASLGLVKAQQEQESAARESDARLREAQTVRNQAGAAALTQRQQDAASLAAQQASGSMGAILGDSLVQSVQQGAQAAGQAVGGAAGGRMSGAVGQMLSGGGSANAGGAAGGGAAEVMGGAANAGASAAVGQIFGGGASAPATAGATGGDGATAVPASMPVAAPVTPAVAADTSAMSAGSKRYIGPPIVSSDQNVIRDNKTPQVRGVFDAVCPKHGKYGGEIGKVKGCPQCEAEKRQLWDACCPVHGKYGGQGPITSCPKCADEAKHLLPRGGLR